jgi:hypothetical protein
MAEAVADTLVEIGVPPSQIRTERFGPTGSTMRIVEAPGAIFLEMRETAHVRLRRNPQE